MNPVTAQELQERLKKEKDVTVCGMTFRIRRAPLLLLADENEDLWSLARQGHEVISGRIKDLVASPSLPRMKRVLMAGVAEPRLSWQHEENAVCVDLVLADHSLASGLFVEIINFSLSDPDAPVEG